MKNRSITSVLALIAMLIGAFALAACDSPTGPGGGGGTPVTGVTLNKATTYLLTERTENLTATITPANATNQAVTWQSSDTDVATVSGGVVTGVSVGTATITVTTADGGKTASCTVIVANFIVYDKDTWNAAVSAIKDGGNNKDYTVAVTDNFSMTGVTANTFGSVTGIHVTIVGGKEISLVKGSSSNGSLLRIGANQSVTINDLKLKGKGQNDYNNTPLVYVNGTDAVFAMSGSASVSGNYINYGGGGGVYVSGGTFTMSDNASVSRNRVSNNSSNSGGGGVLVDSGIFDMRDSASVSGNSARSGGGGVYVYSSSGKFRIESGTVYGNSEGSLLSNTTESPNGAALNNRGTAQRGTFSDSTWTSKAVLSSTNNTIRVANGELQQ